MTGIVYKGSYFWEGYMTPLTLDQIRHLQEGASLVIILCGEEYRLGTWYRDEFLSKEGIVKARAKQGMLTLDDGSIWTVVEIVNNLKGPSPLWETRLSLALGEVKYE